MLEGESWKIKNKKQTKQQQNNNNKNKTEKLTTSSYLDKILRANGVSCFSKSSDWMPWALVYSCLVRFIFISA